MIIMWVEGVERRGERRREMEERTRETAQRERDN
jgi:hypothetical protein